MAKYFVSNYGRKLIEESDKLTVNDNGALMLTIETEIEGYNKPAVSAIRGIAEDGCGPETFRKPLIGFKVERPGGNKGEKPLIAGQWTRKYQERIIPGHAGFHFISIDAIEVVPNWYRDFDENNLVWVVQASPNIKRGKGDAFVTDQMLPLFQLSWEEVNNIIDKKRADATQDVDDEDDTSSDDDDIF